jgi:hypothetical protein
LWVSRSVRNLTDALLARIHRWAGLVTVFVR